MFEAPRGARRMQLRYGFNEIDGWAAFSRGSTASRSIGGCG